MSIPVLYDACVLSGNEVRDLLIRIAISGPHAGSGNHGRGSRHSDQQPVSLDEGSVRDCVHQIARGRTRPPKTYEAVLNTIERVGLVGSAAALRD